MKVNVRLSDPLHLYIDSDNREYLIHLREYFSYYVPGYEHMPKFQATDWNGKISLFKHNQLPYGLISDFIKFNKTYYPILNISISPKIGELFKGIDPSYNTHLKFTPYPYQDEAIRKVLSTSKCIVRSTTASGKSVMIAYILDHIQRQNFNKQQIIIVPNIGLVKQFYTDLIDYGFNKENIGRIYSEIKEYDKPITISTWQSLMNRVRILDRFTSVFVDETHGAKADQLKNILMNCPNALFRTGFTGTLPTDDLTRFQIKSYLGPIIADYPAAELAKEGYVANCTINRLLISYKNKPTSKSFFKIRDGIFDREYRKKLILELLNILPGSSLILVNKVETEGENILNYLKNQPKLKNKKIVFLSGKDSAETRDKWRKECDKRNDIIIIATFGIFATGINIKSLKYLIFGSSTKSEIRTLQSIGRALRQHEDKVNGAFIYDICDRVKFLEEHSQERLYYYKQEKFLYKDISIFEGYTPQFKNLMH